MSAIRFWLLALTALLWACLQTVRRMVKVLDVSEGFELPQDGTMEDILTAQRSTLRDLRDREGSESARLARLREDVRSWLKGRGLFMVTMPELKERYRGEGADLPRVLGLLVMEGLLEVRAGGADTPKGWTRVGLIE